MQRVNANAQYIVYFNFRQDMHAHSLNFWFISQVSNSLDPYDRLSIQRVNCFPVFFQAVLQAGSQLTLMLLLFITIAVVITLKFSKQKIIQVRMCRNKTILMVFITLILIYFMCYTSVWMQAMQFKGSFEKSVSSNVS